MIDVSIIVPSWNAKDHLYKCLDSILHEIKHLNAEIIVVDNASTDGAQEMVGDKFPGVKLVRNKENLGFAKACNIGMRNARGRYFCLINSDIVLGSQCLERMVNYLELHPEIGVLGPKVLNPDGSLQQTRRKFPTLWNSYCRAFALDKIFPQSPLFAQQFMSYLPDDTIQKVDILSGCLLMVRASSLDKVGLLDESYFMFAEDKDWCKRFWEENYSVVYYPEAEALHHHFGSASKDPVRFYVEEVKANMLYWIKHHSRFEQVAFAASVYLHQMVRIGIESIVYVILPSKRVSAAHSIRRSLACIRWMLRRP